jgi:hypothetical protein
MKKHLLWGLLILFIHCATFRDVYVNPKYRGNSCKKRTLTILPLMLSTTQINNLADFNKCFKTDSSNAKQCIQDSSISVMKKMVLRNRGFNKKYPVDTTAIRYRSPDGNDQRCFNEQDISLETSDGNIPSVSTSIKIAKSECFSAPVDIGVYIYDANFGLLVKDEFSEGTIPGPVMGPNGLMPSDLHKSGNLSVTFSFTIWDYTMHKLVSCGTVTSIEPIYFSISKNTWMNLYKDMIFDALKKTPYELTTFQ